MGLKNFRASDFNKDGSDVEVAKSKRDDVRKSEPEPTTQPVVTGNPDDVPDGTVPEIMTWVGEDSERAQKALDKEQEDEKPRKGLVAQLEGLTNTEEDSADTESADDEKEDDE